MAMTLEEKLDLFMQRMESEVSGINETLEAMKGEQKRLNDLIIGDGGDKKGLRREYDLLSHKVESIDAWIKKVGTIALLPVGTAVAIAVNAVFGSNAKSP